MLEYHNIYAKKSLSDTSLANRLPYAIVTKIVEHIDVKRLELNRLIQFLEKIWDSFINIIRRNLNYKFKGRFYRPEYNSNDYPDAAAN